MATFSEDPKWLEAKRAVGTDNWLEIISYYREIGGKDVFVYSILHNDKRLIIDILENEEILMLTRTGEAVLCPYQEVMSSKKVFKYNTDNQKETVLLGSHEYTVTIESHKETGSDT